MFSLYLQTKIYFEPEVQYLPFIPKRGNTILVAHFLMLPVMKIPGPRLLWTRSAEGKTTLSQLLVIDGSGLKHKDG